MSSAIADSVNQLRGGSPAKEWDGRITRAAAEYHNFLLLSLVMHEAQFQSVLCQLPQAGVSWSPLTTQLLKPWNLLLAREVVLLCGIEPD